MTLHQLQYFAEIVRQRSFTRAARQLHISQPALSKSVRLLEQEFEAEFIDRNAKDFALTDSGALFYEYAQKLLAFTDAQTREIRQRIQNAADTLHIGIPPTSGSIYYHTLISQFQATYPDIVLQITEVPSRRILSLLDEGQLDLGVVLEPISREAYVTRPVVRSEIVAVVSRNHPLAGCGTISLSRLRDEPLLMISQDFMFSGVVESLCRQADFAPRGVAFFPKALMDKHPRSEAVCLHLQDPAAPWILSRIERSGFYRPLCSSFWSYANHELRKRSRYRGRFFAS